MNLDKRFQKMSELKCKVCERSTLTGRENAANDLAVLGHELRNPLSALAFALESWPNSKVDPQLEQRLVNIMRRQVKQLTKLCEDWLDARRFAEGGWPIDQQSIDLRRAILEASDEVRPFATSCGHTLTVEVGKHPMRVLGDTSRLTQVFGNLLYNAAKFTDRGGRLHIAVERNQDSWVVRCSDDGRGMSAERIDRIFKGSNQPENGACIAGEGLGIGLRLAKSIVDLHGGSLEAFSEGVGKGSTFVVRLPIFTKQGIIATDHLIDECVGTQETKILLPQFQVLVVDDDRSMRFLVSALLQKLHQKVTIAANGLQAMEIIHRSAPEVVILDLQMHGLDGFEVARRIRSRAELQHVALIALSGRSDAASRKLAADSGFDHYLVKPTRLFDLARTLHQIAKSLPCTV